jgi:hypothetical protein
MDCIRSFSFIGLSQGFLTARTVPVPGTSNYWYRYPSKSSIYTDFYSVSDPDPPISKTFFSNQDLDPKLPDKSDPDLF